MYTPLTPERAGPEHLAHPDVVADPYPFYDALRARSPLPGYVDYPPGTVPGEDDPVRAWALLKHADVLAAAKDHQTFSSRDPLQEGSAAPTLMLVNHDEPEHGKLRRIVSKAFTPKRVRELGPWCDALAAEMLDGLGDREIDVMREIAADFPARVMVHLLGLPEADARRFKGWANAFMLSSDLRPEERNRSNQELVAYFVSKVSERAASVASGAALPPGLITALMSAEVDGETLSADEVVRFCLTLVVAGSETTMYFIGNVLAALAEHPTAYERVRADRSMVPRLLDETLRWSGPPQRLFRIATREVEVGEARIAAGDWVALFFAAANYDPAVFPDPRTFDLDRENAADHLTYGVGIHYCLGAPLANLELTSIVNALADRFQSIEPGLKPRQSQTASLLQHGYTVVPVVLRR